MNTSPRDLMPMLQQQQLPWKPRTRDKAVQEILWERREAIETGKLKGRRLFEPIQRGGGTTILLNDVLSSDDHMGQESEVMSLSFDYSEDETYSPSSMHNLSCDSKDKDLEMKEEEAHNDVCNAEARVGNGERYIIFMGAIAIALLIFAIYKSWVRRFEENHEVILVPT